MTFSLLAPRVKAEICGTCNGVEGLAHRCVSSLIQELLDSRFAISAKLIEAYATTKEISPSYPNEQFYAEFQKQYSDVLKLAYLNGFSKKVCWLAQVVLGELKYRGSLNLRFHDLLRELTNDMSLYAEVHTNTDTTVCQNSKLLAMRSAVMYRHNTYINTHRQKYTGELDGNVIVSIEQVRNLLDCIPNQCEYGRDVIKTCKLYESTMNRLRNRLMLIDIINRCIERCEHGYADPDLKHLRAFANNLFNNSDRMRELTDVLRYGESVSGTVGTAFVQTSDTADIDLAVVIMTDNVYDLAMYGIEQYTIDRPGVQSALKWTAITRDIVRSRAREEVTA